MSQYIIFCFPGIVFYMCFREFGGIRATSEKEHTTQASALGHARSTITLGRPDSYDPITPVSTPTSELAVLSPAQKAS